MKAHKCQTESQELLFIIYCRMTTRRKPLAAEPDVVHLMDTSEDTIKMKKTKLWLQFCVHVLMILH